jgi:fructose-1,6-bisphosphatase/inositol monophosphatase family enzyme
LLHGLDQGVVWLVDPLDGTGNFVAGEGPFATMVALLAEGETVASWIFDPVGGSVFSAVKGYGAFANGKAIAGSDSQRPNERASDLRGAILTRFLPIDVRRRVECGRALIGETTTGLLCAGSEYPAIALNSQDFALFWRTLPCDYAPGALFLTEAGGTSLEQTELSTVRVMEKSGLLAAKSHACWQPVRQALLD